MPNTQDTKKIVLFWRPLFSLISLTGIFGAFFIAVLGFWDFFAQILYPNDIHKAENPTFILEKNSGAITEKIGEAILSESSTSKVSTPQDVQTLREFKKEQISINAEIEDIIDDMVDIDNLIEIHPGTDTSQKIISQNQPLPNTPMNRTEAVSMPLMGNDGASSVRSTHFLRSIDPITMLIPEYPKTMPIYRKSGSDFSPEEMRLKSGTGIDIQYLITEKNTSIIEQKLQQQLEGKTLEQEATISYVSMKKRGENKSVFYLIPNLRYSTKEGKIIFVPIIRGFE